eukprot:Pompholyxophrys_sp_v1_NODE_5_length_12280_cov_3.373988.p6 type:complete len:246 gc:universal NODE_5_length_12280_cov_3.373988:4866-4129(-)
MNPKQVPYKGQPNQNQATPSKCQISNYKPIWNGLNNLRDDLCAQNLNEFQSQLPGCYTTDNFFRWCETQEQYANLMTEPAQFYKPYRNACKVDVESVLRNAELTNMGEIYHLYTKPYVTVPYMGAGSGPIDAPITGVQSRISQQPSNSTTLPATVSTTNVPSIIDLESQLQQGFITDNRQACNPTSGVTINRFSCLPIFGNPQRVEHIIPPWVNGGENSRDYVRRVNYQQMCLNKQNNNIINRTQ